MKKTFLLALCIGLLGRIWAQETFPINGIQDPREQVTAFTHATIWVDAQTQLTDATLLIQGDKIMAVGKDVPVPAHGRVVELAVTFP